MPQTAGAFQIKKGGRPGAAGTPAINELIKRAAALCKRPSRKEYYAMEYAFSV